MADKEKPGERRLDDQQNKEIQKTNFLPSQDFPSSLRRNPTLHEQLYEPLLFEQFAFTSQLLSSEPLHSFISLHSLPLPK